MQKIPDPVLLDLPVARFARSCTAAVLAAGFVFGLLGSGCSSTLPPDAMAEAAGTGEKPVAMKGNTNYFEAKVAAMVTISRGYDRGADRGKQGPIRGRRKDASTVGISDAVPSFSGNETEKEEKEMYEDLMRRAMALRAAGAPMPPVTIRLKLENHGTQPLEVELLEVNSYLGNFAVRPTRLTIAPGQTGEAEPMVSQLGVTSDEIPMTVTLRFDGKKETQIIPVKSLFTGMEKAKS